LSKSSTVDSDAIFRKTVQPFLDLEKFIKHIAIEICLADSDGFSGNWGMNNFYLSRRASLGAKSADAASSRVRGFA
jgi:spore coat protein CotH